MMDAELKKVGNAIFEMEKQGEMNASALVFGIQGLVEEMKKDRTLWQLRNVASMPGIVKHAMVMPDGHEGYGFPIGGVAAFDGKEGVVSPGGVGYDINCGVRLVTTPLTVDEVKPRIREICDRMFENVPSGVGSKSQKLRVSTEELGEVSERGVEWAVENGYGRKEDLERTEEYGKIEGADYAAVSELAKKRGSKQIGTLGAGNHFLEVQEIGEVFLPEVAEKFGLREGMACVMIHTGSRGFGHQICSDHLKAVMKKANELKLPLPDQQLVYVPLETKEAQDYLDAMRCAVNYAFVNRHAIMHWVRESFDSVFGEGTSEEMHLVYDVAHNIAKKESHEVDGKKQELIVHRKGATRAFPAGREELPPLYRDVGQPVLIPGSMGTASYVLVGREKGLGLSFGSSCHGSGRTMSRKQAVKTHKGNEVSKGLWDSRKIYVRAADMRVVAEEAPDAYKNVDDVVKSVAEAGISDIVAKLRPLGVVKG
ncbi:RNA-splicing ligase RtcB [Candidatus Micrarchaeota archaeon]|nr:RNA-splicing ligase RtcB [Candidatus Micrarchaeota archaeon]MBD3418472.1 RNA-splicing ligase RtcB [Candidatus Micrarchaeota archaeon]